MLMVSFRWLWLPPVASYPHTAARLHSHWWYPFGPFTFSAVSSVMMWPQVEQRVDRAYAKPSRTSPARITLPPQCVPCTVNWHIYYSNLCRFIILEPSLFAAGESIAWASVCVRIHFFLYTWRQLFLWCSLFFLFLMLQASTHSLSQIQSRWPRG